MPKNINYILMRTVAVLLILVFLSTAMVTGRYARYISSASSEDSARVAKFHVTVSEETELISVPIQPGQTAEMFFSVTNDSEVAVALAYEVKNVHNNLPLEFLHPVSDAVGPGKTVDVPLKITWPAGQSNDNYIGMVDLLEISVRAVQVD